MERNIKVIGFLLLIFLSGNAYAACNVTATGINFGIYDVFKTTPLDSTGSVTVTCDETPPPTIKISISRSNNSGSFIPRQMRHATKADFLNYNLFTNASMTEVWGDGTGGTSTVLLKKVSKNKPEIVIIYGRIPPGQDVSAGSYSDTLTVTITR